VVDLKSSPSQLRFLVIDDVFPDPSTGGGAPRAVQVMRAIADSGAIVTLYPTMKLSRWRSMLAKISPKLVRRKKILEAFLRQRHADFDVIFISRPHNMMLFNKVFARLPDALRSKFIVYDAEAVFASRVVLQWEVLGKPMSQAEANDRVKRELELARHAHTILTVGDHETRLFHDAGYKNIHVLRHALKPSLTLSAHGARSNFLFVGATGQDDAPNSDAVMWFADNVLPKLTATLSPKIKLSLVGESTSKGVRQRESRGIEFHGQIPDLRAVYENARVFVAPTRFSSGVPLKIYDAAVHGVPCVVTSLLAGQLGWSHEREILVADTPEDFAEQCRRLYLDEVLWERIRIAAYNRVLEDCDPGSFDHVIEDICARASQHASADPVSGLR